MSFGLKDTQETFSALISTMIPNLYLGENDTKQNPSELYDQFGFIISEIENYKPCQFEEDAADRVEWLKFIEFNHTNSLGVEGGLADIDGGIGSDESFWNRVNTKISPSKHLTNLIWGFADDNYRITSSTKGIPHTIRPQLWPRILGSIEKKTKASQKVPPEKYLDIVQASNEEISADFKQIEKDLLRTMPTNVCFSDVNSIGIPRLRRILRALAFLYVDIGYCQGLGMITATLLLFMEEETTFWMMCSIIEDVLPPSYYSSKSLLGIQTDQLVLVDLMKRCLPRLTNHLLSHNIDIPMITLPWFVTLYAGHLPIHSLLRFWDILFYEGSSILFKLTLFILKFNEDRLLQMENISDIFRVLSNLPSEVEHIETFLKLANDIEDDYLNMTEISSIRRHHLAQLLSNEIQNISQLLPSSQFIGENNQQNSRIFPKQYLSKREIKPPKGIFPSKFNSIASYLRFDSIENIWCHNIDVDPRLKNVKQTEMLVDLRLAIIQIIKNFRTIDPKYLNVETQPNYSVESHSNDLDNYIRTANNKYKRARAIADFQRKENEEIGFRKNDLIKVLSRRDDLCWYGEINGLRGLFPSTHVKLLDERSGEYSPAGDQSVNPEIARLVHKNLIPSMINIFRHGLKRPGPLSDYGCHPWHFVEEASNKAIQSQYTSVHSRLNLCKTFSLDQDGRVLTPEELLYNSIKKVSKKYCSLSKNGKMGAIFGANLDNKFECLFRYGLNEQVLHMWLESIVSSQSTVNKWYSDYSYLKSPAWVQIKCELRVLSQFSFNLSVDPENLLEPNDNCKKPDSIPSPVCNGIARTTEKSQQKTTMSAEDEDNTEDNASIDERPRSAAQVTEFNAEDTTDLLVKHHLFSWEL